MHWRVDRWLFGLPAIAILTAVAAWRVTPDVEAELRRGVDAIEQGLPDLRADETGTRLDVDGRDVTLVSEPRVPLDALARLSGAVARIPGVRRVLRLTIQPKPMQPFVFGLRRTGARVTLTGGLPSGELRRELVSRIGSVLPPESVVDRADLGTGEPDGFADAARFAAALILAVPGSEASLSGRTYAFAATAPDAASYRAALDLLRSPPPGFEAGQVSLVPPLVADFVWIATREAGAIVLSGNVPSEAERAELTGIVRDLVREARVDDRMQTARGLPREVDFGTLGRSALAVLAGLDTGAVALSGRKLDVSGRAVARDVLAKVASEVAGRLPSGVTLGRLDLKPIPASPFVVAMHRGPGGVTLSGYAPDEPARAALLDRAARRFPTQAVRNELHIADGAPSGWSPAALAAMDRLAEFAEGEARLSDRTVSLTGRVLYRELAERLAAQAAGALPSGWTAATAIASEPDEKPLALDVCRDLLGDALRRDPVRFEPGRAELTSGSRKVLDGMSEILRRCGPGQVRVRAAGDPGSPETARDVARARAEAVVAVLRAVGFSPGTLPAGDPAKAGASQVDLEFGP